MCTFAWLYSCLSQRQFLLPNASISQVVHVMTLRKNQNLYIHFGVDKIYVDCYSFSLSFACIPVVKLDWRHVFASSTIFMLGRIVPVILDMWKSYGTSICSLWDIFSKSTGKFPITPFTTSERRHGRPTSYSRRIQSNQQEM